MVEDIKDILKMGFNMVQVNILIRIMKKLMENGIKENLNKKVDTFYLIRLLK